jgi:hypothetical protein
MHGTISSKTILNTVDPQYNIGTGRQFQDPSYKLSALYVKLTLIQFWNPWYYVQLYSDWNTRNLRYISDFISPMLLALGGERRYSTYSFSTSALDGCEWSPSRPTRTLAPGERTPGTQCTGGWVGPRVGLDTKARGKILSPLPGIEPQLPGHPAHGQTFLYVV